MPVKTLVAVAAMLAGLSAQHAYAQAGSGASAPTNITAPTPSGDQARSSTLGDPGKPRVRPRPARRRPSTAGSTQNGSTVDRASAAGGGR